MAGLSLFAATVMQFVSVLVKCISLKWCVTLLIILSVAGLGVSQKMDSFEKDTSCGVGKTLTTSQRKEQAAVFLEWKSQVINTNKRETGSVKFTIPVVFHLIEHSPSISDSEIIQLVSSLNDAFSHSGEFREGSLGVDTEIEFCLAQKAPDGGLATGITRISSDYEKFDMDLEDSKLKTITQWDPRHYMNVWIVTDINSEILRSYTGRDWWYRCKAGGYATLPDSPITQDYYTDGIVMAGLHPSILAHECGHYLGLLHTFEGGCKNDNCLEDGDMVCDTPPDKSFQNSCEDNSCATDTLSNYSNNTFFEDVPDMGSNFMDYDGCPSDFSAGQRDRMHFHLEQYRKDLFLESPSNNTVCDAPCDANISVGFTQDESHPLPDMPVSFESDVTGANTFEWYVEYLGEISSDYSVVLATDYTPTSPVIATTPDLTHTFLSEGKYRVYVKVWDDSDPACFAASSKIVKVTCGVDARYWPDKRFIAAKQPIALFLDSVTFTNRSTGASSYEWTITHTNFISGVPNLPEFNSTDEHLVYAFPEPGEYAITLKAADGLCEDTADTFFLTVVDPTIDGVPSIRSIDCYNNDSIKVELRLYNYGYDTVNVGMPLSFYDGDPTQSNTQPSLLKTYFLPEIVYGFDSADYTLYIKTKDQTIDQMYVVFNDPGSTSFPITFPEGDNNVMSFNSIAPPSGYTELSYDNNFTSGAAKHELLDLFSDVWACVGDMLEFEVDTTWQSVNWNSHTKGELGDSNPLSYIVEQEDTLNVRLETDLGCEFSDSFLVHLSSPEITTSGDVYRIVKGKSVQLNASGGEDYFWSPPDGLNNPLISSPVATPEISTLYTVQVADSVGCTITAEVQVFVETSAYIPNLFSPNSDAQNDYLKIYGLEDVANISFKIYNRSGSLVYETASASEASTIGWDGSVRGKDQPNGVYYWKVSGNYNNGNTIFLNGERAGAIHLIR